MYKRQLYKYEQSTGRLLEETQLDKNNALLHRIAYKYDAAGKQLGYSVFDAKDKLIRTTDASPQPK